MSASKLLIHKIGETGIELKYLYVTIDDDDFSPRIEYSEWVNGKTEVKKKGFEKSSRLVVKIVSGNEIDRFNLNSNAIALNQGDTYLLNSSYVCGSNPLKEESFGNMGIEYNKKYREDFNNGLANQMACFQNKYDNGISKEKHSQISESYMNPLEHSLERVKENNARIMENIHMLNRTLNYTKKKEILDIGCTKSLRSFPCNTCGKCFVYETGLRRHYAMRHAVAEIQPRWQIVWTCIQCFQVWPRQDQALKHSSECCKSGNMDCVREIKTSSLLQCEFCEKVYTSIPRLLRHTKNHTTANNYECNACGMAFVSCKTAEQHWVLCPWLRAYYSFSLPKLLLCNACDRKFRNYDHLYNHRYKVGHFTMKSHCNQGSLKPMGMLVYQCEMCSQCFPSINPLKLHKDQYHPRHDIAMQCRMDKPNKDGQSYRVPAENEYELVQNQGYTTHRDSMQHVNLHLA